MIIVTGMSGAGKSTAISTLEDIGYFCIDNMPANLFSAFVKMSSSEDLEKTAFVCDTRGGVDGSNLISIINALNDMEKDYEILFLDASDFELIKRYKLTRRKHPLIKEADYSLEKAIEFERKIISPIREKADIIIDTTDFSSADFKNRIFEIFKESRKTNFFINCMSFGFKHGLPKDADLVFDVRCLPNPFYIPELKPLTGLDEELRDYVLGFPESIEFLSKIIDLIDFSLPLYKKEGRSQMVIAIGCTGGKHRSVTFAEKIKNHLLTNENKVMVTHRDIIR